MIIFSLEDFRGIYNIPFPASEEGAVALDSELSFFEKKALSKIVGQHTAMEVMSYIEAEKTPANSKLDTLIDGGDYVFNGENKSFIGLQDLENSPVKDLIYYYWLQDDQGKSIGLQTEKRKEADYTDLSLYMEKYISLLVDKVGDIELFFATERFSSDDNGCLYDFVKHFPTDYLGFKVSRFTTKFLL